MIGPRPAQGKPRPDHSLIRASTLGAGPARAYFGGSTPQEETPMAIQVGDHLPEATFTTPSPEGPQQITTDQVFKGKKVVLFALPGAFTPTCSARHLPGFKDKAADFKAKGVDTIACLSVNDAFVMAAWAKDQGVEGQVLMLADGNADFTKKVGLEFDGAKFGMGVRSQRYALVAEDGVVTSLDVEQPGEFKVSAAEYVLEKL
jgi:peroxiredoxin